MLGRESVLRKTMLDECKGDKFFEVLAYFSNVVLKKVLATRNGSRKDAVLSRKWAMAATLAPDKQASMLPLAIAHKAALVNALKKKEEKRRRFRDFEGLLNDKAGDIHQRMKQSKATPRAQKSAVPEKDAAAIQKQLKDHWIGDQKWLDVMLHGDHVQVEDAFLSMRFSEVWPMVEQGRRLEDARPEVGLLENLQLRVQEQQQRLQKWKSFHERLRQDGSNSNAQRTKAPALVKEVKFDEHLKLQLQSSKSPRDESLTREPLRSNYQDILSDMNEELSRISQAKYNRSALPSLRRTTSSLSGSRSPVRRRVSRSDSTPKKPVYNTHNATEKSKKPAAASRKHSQDTVTAKPSAPSNTHSQQVVPIRRLAPSRNQSQDAVPARPRRLEPTMTPIDSDATLVGHPSTALRTVPSLPPPEEPHAAQFNHEVIEETSDPLPTASSPPPPPAEPPQPPFESPQPSSYWPSEPPVLEPPPLNTEDALAEQIISSISHATPSPVKMQPRLSLMERTRMSMVRTNSFEPITESPSLPEPLEEPSQTLGQPLDRRASLLERTRLSMAAMSQNPRTQTSKKDKRRSSARQSLYPVNQFDTPRNRKSFQAIEEGDSGSTTPKEILFSDDIDYDRIFKSRPRIAQSPIFSPDTTEFGGAVERNEDGHGEEVADGDISGLGLGVSMEDEYDEGVTGVDLDDVDRSDDEDGFTREWENSPLRRAGGGVRAPVTKGKLFS